MVGFFNYALGVSLVLLGDSLLAARPERLRLVSRVVPTHCVNSRLYSRSTGFFIDSYRLFLYAFLLGSLWIGHRASLINLSYLQNEDSVTGED